MTHTHTRSCLRTHMTFPKISTRLLEKMLSASASPFVTQTNTGNRYLSHRQIPGKIAAEMADTSFCCLRLHLLSRARALSLSLSLSPPLWHFFYGFFSINIFFRACALSIPPEQIFFLFLSRWWNIFTTKFGTRTAVRCPRYNIFFTFFFNFHCKGRYSHSLR